jgi:hypothetical protein
MKESIIEYEHLVLRVIAFDTTADLPHSYILNIAKQMRLENQEVKFAWMFMNDSFRDRRVISTPPAVIACACLHLGMTLNSKGRFPIAANGGRKTSISSSSSSSMSMSLSLSMGASAEEGDVDDEESFLAKWWGLYGISDNALWEAAEWISACSNPS